MAPKRKADDISDEADSYTYHPNFPLYPEADLRSTPRRRPTSLASLVDNPPPLQTLLNVGRHAPRRIIPGRPPTPRKHHNRRGNGGSGVVVEVFTVAVIHGLEDLTSLYGKVFTTPGYSWIDAGDDFMNSAYPGLLFSSVQPQASIPRTMAFVLVFTRRQPSNLMFYDRSSFEIPIVPLLRLRPQNSRASQHRLLITYFDLHLSTTVVNHRKQACFATKGDELVQESRLCYVESFGRSEISLRKLSSSTISPWLPSIVALALVLLVFWQSSFDLRI
ncbi:hypothetical protein BDY24DRAFT_415523 [Mrakia frigida]|uniref:uncharacterized protein n=1 Tax=Mrakia frigida TaxID=29902 RepID=UPI003FCBFA81